MCVYVNVYAKGIAMFGFQIEGDYITSYDPWDDPPNIHQPEIVQMCIKILPKPSSIVKLADCEVAINCFDDQTAHYVWERNPSRYCSIQRFGSLGFAETLRHPAPFFRVC